MKILMPLLALLLVSKPSYAQTPDISGKWDVTIVSSQGTMPPAALELRKQAEKFVGTFNTSQGTGDVEATIKDKTVTFVLPPYQTSQGALTLTMIGTLEGEAMQTMKGTIDVGGQQTLDWSATRTPAASQAPSQAPPAESKTDLSGTWALEVTTGQGTGTPTVVLKQEGEKLSGQYTGQLGEAAITGTIKGDEFTFSFPVTVEGNTGTVIYTGKAEKDTMKGTISLAGMGDGTFTGKKK